ncbi:MerR family transcriptional regulator [Holdemania massiliensis]|uniref:MerR family transcriptional regulator n=1 Tax=Holdemania massiliensis TaxID=1468449 RepID=A0A6N7S2X4_9FIRM|nr:MerR family transcriptional regulator [Holdemania massiliensis]MSA69810.1 MerR family transcriptional regulator [Holdemania massiliensis]MSA88020.1 MerR family transcriptional regulator [Holdemania massiliensis]MSB76890.1 MerR family transcriptional regulator [Holdemania massiliensis]MSC31816.1 MerR family transcriptional regulator [Holdemania massiliensis]MSC38136.1 MerR family transcriptional regulator [Holdemania massiliensis]
MLKIGDFSKMGKTTVKTLRYYDSIGLLRPKQIDADNGYRWYATDQLIALYQIQQWRQLGISVEMIGKILRGEASESVAMDQRRQQISTDLDLMQYQLRRIERVLTTDTKERIMKINVIIKELPACIVMARKAALPHYQDLLREIPATGAKVGQQYPDLKCTQPEYCFVKELDGEYREKDIHAEICQAVETIKPNFDDVEFRKEPKVTAACALLQGSYDRFGEVYAALMQWIEDNHAEIIGEPRESYIDGIWNKESEEEWLTEVQFPIRLG